MTTHEGIFTTPDTTVSFNFLWANPATNQPQWHKIKLPHGADSAKGTVPKVGDIFLAHEGTSYVAYEDGEWSPLGGSSFVGGTVSSRIIPSTNGSIDLGSSTVQWRYIWTKNIYSTAWLIINTYDVLSIQGNTITFGGLNADMKDMTGALRLPEIWGSPATVAHGMMWYDHSVDKFRAREGAATVNMIGGAFTGGTITSDILPNADGTLDLGNISFSFHELWVEEVYSNNSLYLISSDGNIFLQSESAIVMQTGNGYGTFMIDASLSNGFMISVIAGSPSTKYDGMIWYNSTLKHFYGRTADGDVLLG